MGEAKRRQELGIPPRVKITPPNNLSNQSVLNKTLNKYPFLPYIFGISLLIILIIDLINYYS